MGSAKPKFCGLEIKGKSSKIREKNSLQVWKHEGIEKGYYYCAISHISWKITYWALNMEILGIVFFPKPTGAFYCY